MSGQLTGTAGPGVGVAWVTVVTALLWVAVVEEEAGSAEVEGEEEGSVASPCRLSPPC